MQFTRENRNDINKYYAGTYVKFKEHAIEQHMAADTLFYIQSVDEDHVVGKCENGSPFMIWLSDAYPFEVDYVLPHKSFFQLGINAMLLERVPAQQYFRGLHGDNTRMSYMGTNLVPKKQGITFESLKAFVTKQRFYSLKEAMAADGYNSCVLSPRMQYVRINNHIYMDHQQIARVDKDLIVMLKPIFREEVEEMLKATGELEQFTFYEPKTKPAVKKVEPEVTF